MASRTFPTLRDNFSSPIEHLKPKFTPEGKIRTQETRASNIKSKSIQQKFAQKTKIVNKVTKLQALRLAAKQQELHLLAEKSPVGINKFSAQPKKLFVAQKIKASSPLANVRANVENTPTAPKVKKITQVSDIQQIQKTKPQEKMVTAEKTLVENVTSLKNMVVETDAFSPEVKTQKNSTLGKTFKPQEDILKTKKSTPEVVQKNQLETNENIPSDTQKEDKVLSKEPVENQEKDSSKTEISTEKNYELDSLLERAIEEELQDVMIQVWQELPDDPLEEEDRIAVDKLRNEAGDDLRRVLGLNITKRLLNVFNNLFVKMQFTCRPQMGYLTSFLKEYNITKFKRIEKDSNTFAAQMESIEDFDKLCTVKEHMCGEAKISVTPCYKFTQCPNNLKTIYDDTYFYEEASQDHIETKKVNIEIEKPLNENHERPYSKADYTEPSNRVDKTEKDKIKKILQNDDEDVNKISTTVAKEKITNSMTTTIVDKKEEKKVTDLIIIEKEINRVLAKHMDISEDILKDKFEDDVDNEDLDSGIPECQMDGEDELDDEDILALMSEGVVLDECSGSEDEKN